MWKLQEFISQKTFALLCVAMFLTVYCGARLFKIQDMTYYIEESRQDLLIDRLDAEEDTEIEKNDTRPIGVDNITYPTFQSYEAAEFPHIVNGSIRIPHIIHQICNTPLVPDQFVSAMRSFVKHNPTWQYRFWTYVSGRMLLEKHHPYLIDVYDSFGENDVKRADLLRLAVLYEYGGVYVDLDVKNLRSLNKTTTKYACIIPTEPFEHSSILYDHNAILSSAVLLCRPKHPFYKQMLLNLQLANPSGHPVGTSGPVYITENFFRYNNITEEDLRKPAKSNRSNSPYFYKGERDEESDDGIYIPNSQYFMDHVDPSWVNENGELNACLEAPLHTASELRQRGCKEYEKRKVLREERKFTFTFHYWFHLWSQGQDNMRRNDIKDIIPTAILYEG